jgi:chromate transport protein ChrA
VFAPCQHDPTERNHVQLRNCVANDGKSLLANRAIRGNVVWRVNVTLIGLMRAGYRGALAAWTGFTLPSAIALVLFAYGASVLTGPIGTGLLHGLKLVAVAIVAQAVWGMARTLCPDRERASIAVVAALIILFSTSSAAQIGAIVLGGVAGLWFCRGTPIATGHIVMPVTRLRRALSAII